MSFRMRIDLHIPDQDAPNALTDVQQEVIDRFRRDIVGAQSAVVSIGVPDGIDPSGTRYDAIFTCGSVDRPDTVSAQVEDLGHGTL